MKVVYVTAPAMRWFVAMIVSSMLLAGCANPGAGGSSSVAPAPSSSGLSQYVSQAPSSPLPSPSPIASSLAGAASAQLANSPTSAGTVGSAPAGYAVGYGWEGVGGRMLISATVHDFRFDPLAWELSGTTWTSVPAPALQSSPSMVEVLAFDGFRRREVLVAISYAGLEAWEWDGSHWLSVRTNHVPDGLTQNASGAYSPELKAIVLVNQGGMPPSPMQTWLYDGVDWRSLSTANSPIAPFHIDYDASRHSIIGLSLADYSTWLFDGRDWTPLVQAGVSPGGAPRQAPSVALDQRSDQWVLLGGFDGTTANTETWTGDGRTWTKRSPSNSPTQRVGVPGLDNLAWDPSNQRLLLFGGQAGTNGGPLGDTWAWDGSTWTQVAG